MSQEDRVPKDVRLEELVRRLAETEAAIRDLLGGDDDRVVDRVTGTSIPLRPDQAELHAVRSEMERQVAERTMALQRANEELQTANEELQAANEELTTAEETLRRQNAELDAAAQVIADERARYQALFDLAPDGYLLTDTAGKIREANVAAGALLGEAPGRLGGRRLSEFVVDVDRRLLQDQVHRIRLQDRWQAWRWEIRVQPAAGRPFHAAVTAAPVRDGGGEVTGIRWLLRDVTERKQAEAALVAGEERFRLVADFTYDWEYWTGPGGEHLYISPSVERITGYRPQQFFDDPGLMQAMVHPDDRHPLAQHRRDKEQERGVHHLDLRIIRRDGQVRWISHICQPVYREDGTWLGTRGSNRDITWRIQAEARQQQYLARLGALLECARDVVAAQTVEGLLQRVIDAARELTDGQLGTAGYGYRSGTFQVAASSRAEGVPPCPAGETFRMEWGGVYLDILNSPAPVCWTDEELRAHPDWWGLPEGHALLRGLLAARLVGRDGQANGLIMVTDKQGGGEFSAEDVALLGHLAAMASLALQHIEARHDAERRAGELDAVFEAMVDSVIVYDAAGTPVKANRAALDIHGLDPVGLDRQSLADQIGIIHPDGRPVELDETASSRALRGERVAEERVAYTSAAGKTRHVVVSGAPMLDGDQVLGAVVVWHDVTEREQLLAANRLQREFLEHLIDSAPIAIAVVSGPDHRYELVNEAYRAILSSPDTPILGRPMAEVFPGALTDLLDEAYRTRDVVSFRELSVVPAPGREESFWNGDHVPLLGADGEVERLLVLVHDVTEQVRARRRIEEISAMARQRADELDAVFDAMADPVVVVDARGVAFKVNPAMIEMCGEDPVGQVWAPYVRAMAPHRGGGQAIEAGELAVTRALAGETVRELRVGISDRTGQEHTLLASGGPLRDGDRVTGTVVVWHDITRLEQAERARDQLIAILEETPDLVSTASVDGTIRYYNRSARRLLGVPDDADLSSFTIPRGLPPWARDLLEREAIPTAMRAGIWQGRTAAIRHDGTEVPVVQTVLAHRGPDGEVEYLSSVARDVSREEAMMAQLEAERARLKAIVDSAPEGIVVADDEARVLFTNPAADRLYARPVPYGREYESQTSLQICDAAGNPYDPRDLPLTRSALDGETIRDREMSIVWPDGQRRHLLVNTSPIVSGDGRVAGAVGVFQDITERLEMQAALRRAHDELEERVVERTRELRHSEERFRQLAEHIEDVFWLVDPGDGRLLYVSPAYEKVWGRPTAELDGGTEALLASIHPDDRERVTEWLGNVSYGAEQEFRILRPDGSVRWVRSRAFAVPDAAGRAYRVAAVVTDVTQQKQAHLAMLKTERLSMAGQMAASLAHEINNPLQGATGCLELMREAIDEGQDPAHYLDVAFEALSRAGRTVSQLRSLHRGPAIEEKEETDVNELVEASLVLTRKKAAAQQVELTWTPGSNLPPLQLMRDGMHQVFLNLLLNALDAMPDGGRLEVRTEQVDRPRGVRVVFRDSGPGVAPDIMAQLFEPFHTTKPEGTGLGLFVSHNTVERHGGRIGVESSDRGATFTIWLPA